MVEVESKAMFDLLDKLTPVEKTMYLCMILGAVGIDGRQGKIPPGTAGIMRDIEKDTPGLTPILDLMGKKYRAKEIKKDAVSILDQFIDDLPH